MLKEKLNNLNVHPKLQHANDIENNETFENLSMSDIINEIPYTDNAIIGYKRKYRSFISTPRVRFIYDVVCLQNINCFIDS